MGFPGVGLTVRSFEGTQLSFSTHRIVMSKLVVCCDSLVKGRRVWSPVLGDA